MNDENIYWLFSSSKEVVVTIAAPLAPSAGRTLA
jgi:hypothetical protein